MCRLCSRPRRRYRCCVYSSCSSFHGHFDGGLCQLSLRRLSPSSTSTSPCCCSTSSASASSCCSASYTSPCPHSPDCPGTSSSTDCFRSAKRTCCYSACTHSTHGTTSSSHSTNGRTHCTHSTHGTTRCTHSTHGTTRCTHSTYCRTKPYSSYSKSCCNSESLGNPKSCHDCQAHLAHVEPCFERRSQKLLYVLHVEFHCSLCTLGLK
jgi:hypothetical protein